MKEIAIVGGGILGLAISYELSNSNYKISLFEKENTIGKHQSGNNSGVLHSGLYYQPGSLKARLAVEGIRVMTSFCKENKISYENCGKIVVATNDRESVFLDNLAQRGNQNGLIGLKFLNQQELKNREPYVLAKKTLLVPEEGIVDYKEVMSVMSDYIKNKGGKIYLNTEIKKCVETKHGKILLETEKTQNEFDLVINCAGLYADRNYRNLTNNKSPIKIVPFRGEYLQLSDRYKNIVNHLIYPVPDPQYPFLGIHFTRMINDVREVGPNAVLAFKREGYRNSDFSLKDTLDTLSYKGFINFMFKNFSFALGEFASSFSTKSFVSKAKKLIPDIEEYMFEKAGTAGVRAQALDSSGELIMDFRIERHNNQIHILNAPSPGATASLSIAKYIIEKYI